ncbi:uncharacterized protein LACBIDRAFT_316629 [Laccaria bicolor S238N-H82]|uniref:Predicted protein n=1 Tax=Laccaria bicolor (strain S238N-H82 / ATCC MYA-4686) TaxID=486041 RepID=B0E1B6_LACBS|nr:uncharacterized protein LACBIDRAFT_316629 [Laccaria bicolor S238N-H82]EDQ99353.1 predicted protein [Laccaria bicolor S238N-H82]|eukprot:XP_001889999.1 predicted protein [Laccaria bicolor S238N-H82]
MPMIGPDCGFVRGQTRASHHPVIEPTFTSRTSTFKVEITTTVTTPNGPDSSTCWTVTLQAAREALLTVQDGRTDRPDFNQGFLTASFKSSGQSYVDVRCCLPRNGRSWATGNIKWNTDFDAANPPATNPCLRLVERTTAMMSANWNYKTFAFRT